MRNICLAVVMAAAAAGASAAEAGGEGEAEAIITVENLAPRLLGVGAYKGVDNCTKRSSFWYVGTGKTYELKARPGAPYNFSMNQYFGDDVSTSECGFALKFTPVAGGRYRAVYDNDGSRCGYRFVQLGSNGEAVAKVDHEVLDFAIPFWPFQPACKSRVPAARQSPNPGTGGALDGL